MGGDIAAARLLQIRMDLTTGRRLPSEPTALDPTVNTGVSPDKGTTQAQRDKLQLETARSILGSDELLPKETRDAARQIFDANNPLLQALPGMEQFAKNYDLTGTTAYEEQKPLTSAESIDRYANLETGKSWRALQDLGLEFPGTGATAPVFQSDAPAKGVLIGKAVQPAQPATGVIDKTGLTPVIGSEFGEIDRPSRGGYTEPGWNVGAWGDSLEGKDTKLAALPISTLRKYGNPGDKDFHTKFNSQYEIQAVNPNTGFAVSMALGDKGPGESTGAGLDMTWGAREALGLAPNFKGPIQYRVVKKGSALPDGTTSTASTQPAGGAAAASVDTNVYVKPVDPKTLRNPAIYGEKNSEQDNLDWAKNEADHYAVTMEKAGTPLTIEEYKKVFDEYHKGALASAKSEKPTQLPGADLERFTSMTIVPEQLDALLEAKKKAGQFRPPIAVKPGGAAGATIADIMQQQQMAAQSDEQRDFYAKRNLLTPNISKGLGGQTGTPSDVDILNAQSILPTEYDSVEEAERKINDLKALNKKSMEQMIRIRQNGHYDTSALEREYFKLSDDLAKAKILQQNQKANEMITGASKPAR
jgi:hypothetical protein